MKLLTKQIADRLPPLYSQEECGDEAIAQVKFFTPRTNWTATAITSTRRPESPVPLPRAPCRSSWGTKRSR